MEKYSDLPKAEVEKLKDEIAELSGVDLTLKFNEMIRNGKIYNEAFEFLKEKMAEEKEARSKR